MSFGLVYALQASAAFVQDPNLPMLLTCQDAAVAGGEVTNGRVAVTPRR